MSLIFENFTEKHISDAVRLALYELHAASSSCPMIPEGDYSEKLSGMLYWLSGQRFGKTALFDGKVVGYMLFGGPWDGMFGEVKGVFSPLGGSAFSYEQGIDRGRLASKLFAEISAELVQEQVFSCAICRYANDMAAAEAFVLNGFGIRCSDAIAQLSSLQLPEYHGGARFTELKRDDFRSICGLRQRLDQHLSAAPIFCTSDPERFEAWYSMEDLRIFTAELCGETVAFIAIAEEGENFLTEGDLTANICGAFTDERFRGSGLTQGLLGYVCETLKSEGRKHLGVDYETLNPTALNFWSKYFTPYTYSYARRFDER